MPPKSTAAATVAAAVAGTAAPTNPQELSPADYSTYRQLVYQYEMKQFKKAIKLADSLLKKYPLHGETLAMKALVYSAMYKREETSAKRREEAIVKREEAYALVKKGTALNIKSAVCWHVYGLIYRNDLKYEDAIKCFQNALKRDNDNQQILRDVAQLQVQLHMYDAFRETRQRILMTKATQRTNWLLMALALHFCGEWTKAYKVLDVSLGLEAATVRPIISDTRADDELTTSSEDERVKALETEMQTFWRVAPKAALADSEAMLYRYLVTLDSNDLKAAYNYLVPIVPLVTDKLFVVEHRAFLLSALQRLRESEVLYRALIRRNPDNLSYHHGLLRALHLRADVPDAALFQSRFSVSRVLAHHPSPIASANARAVPALSIPPVELCCSPDELPARIDELYTSLAAAHPHSLAVTRLPLSLLPASHPAFQRRLTAYMQRSLRKGIPSLFSDLLTLYDDAEKARLISSNIHSIVDNLRAHGTFDGAQATRESPSCLLWALYFIGQHYDHLGDHVTALKYSEEAYRHTPTCLDTLMLRARILKHAGSPQAAFTTMDQARQLDLADRYTNTKCVRYALRAGKRAEAEQLVALFLRDGDGLNGLVATQTTWYERALGYSYEQAGQYGRALKQYKLVDKHFVDFIEDAFDFHFYSVRKSAMRAFVDFLDWHRTVRSHRFFVYAAYGIVRIYLRLHEQPIEEEERKKVEAADELTDEERKQRDRLRKKQAAKEKKKAQADERKQAEEVASAKARSQVKSKVVAPVDPDPEGAALLTLSALDEATKYVNYLQLFDANAVETWLFSARLAWRKSKWLLMWHAIKHGLRIEAEHPELHFLLMMLVQQVQVQQQQQQAAVIADALVLSVLSAELADAKLDVATPVLQLNQAFAERHATSLAHRLAAARVALQITYKRKLAAALLSDVLATTTWLPSSLTVAYDVQRFLSHALCDDEAVERFNAFALQRFPLCSRFGAVDEAVSLAPVVASPDDLSSLCLPH